MVEGIADDGILFGKERTKQTTIGIEAGCIENGVFCLEILRYSSLKLLVDILGAANEAHGRHAVATAIHHLLGSLDQAGVVAQAKIVVGAKVEHFLTFHLNGSSLRTLNDAFFLVETGCFKV